MVSVKSEYEKLRKESFFAMSKALGFNEPCDGQRRLHSDGFSHIINFGDVENVCEWLFKNGFDVIKNP